MKGRIVGFIVSCLILCGIYTPARVFAGNSPDQGHFYISATSAPADGSSVSNVQITLHDAGDAAVPNDNVTISSTDSTTRFNSSPTLQSQLDGNGNFTFSMTTTTVGGVNLTVLDTTTNTTLTGSVTFYQPGTASPTPTPSAPGTCTDAAPGSTVQLTSAVSAGAHSITLTWTDASNPVSYYLLSYGLSSGTYMYGDPNIGGQGTTSFTVGGLASGTKYYFVIRAGNGCTPGAFSNEVSAVAGAVPTPTPLPADTTSQSDVVPTDTPELPTDTPAPTETVTPAPVPTSGGNSFVSRLMIGATAVGIICAVAGGVFYLRMKR